MIPAERAAPEIGAAFGSDAARVPAAFVPNLGQWSHGARYVATLGPVTAHFDARGWWLGLCASAGAEHDLRSPRERGTVEPAPAVRGATLRMSFCGSGDAELVGEERLAGVHNYFLGDPARWRTDVPRYAALRYRGMYPGVEVRCYENGGHLEYDLLLERGATLRCVEVQVQGATAPLRIDADGVLVIETAAGPLRQSVPVSWEVLADGTRRTIASCHELRGADRFGFEAPGWDGGSELVLDPGLLYSTVLGGAGGAGEVAWAVAVDADGVATMAGSTGSPGLPTTPGAWDSTLSGRTDAFVARLDPRQPTRQQLVYLTYLGGSATDSAVAVSLDPAGVATVAGVTASADFPVTSDAWGTTHGGGDDGFVARLDPRLSGAAQLVYATFLGGSSNDSLTCMSLETSGSIAVAGSTVSADFPLTANAWDRSLQDIDAFVAHLDPRLLPPHQLVYSTYLGGSAIDAASAVSRDADGVTTLAGSTRSADFPTTPDAWDPIYRSPSLSDTFVARLDPRLPPAQQLVYATYLGGSGRDDAHAMSVDAAGVVTMAGTTSSNDFTTTLGAFQRTRTAFTDGFVVRLDPRLPPAQQLEYATLFDGSRSSTITAVHADAAGLTTVAGFTDSPDLPTTAGTWDSTHNGWSDAFVARLDPRLSGVRQLVYSSYLGSLLDDHARAVSVDAAGVATVVGGTGIDYPTTPGAWTWLGLHPAFLTRLDLLPTGAELLGASSPGCKGPLAIGVTSMPRVGNASLEITCRNAPPAAMGALLFAASGLASPDRLLDVDVWVDPRSAWFFGVPVSSHVDGTAYCPEPVPPNPLLVGAGLVTQFLWLGPAFPPPCPPSGLSASNALAITIVP